MTAGYAPKVRLLAVMSSMLGGGAERQMSMVLERIDRARFEPSLCLCERRGPFLDRVPPDVPVLDLGKHSARDAPRLIVRLARLLRDRRPDLVYASGDYANEIASFAHLLARSDSTLVLAETSVQSRAIPNMSHPWLRRRLLTAAYRRADAVLGPSPGVLEDLRQVTGLTAGSCHLVRSMIAPEEIRSAAEREAVVPFADSDLPLLVSVGRLRREKGHPDLLRAMEVLRERTPCNLVILGEGPDRPRLEALRRELDLESSVSLPGFAGNPFPAIARADLFVSPSHFESFGIAILEAMALDTPVVSTAVESGPKWIVEDGVNGLLCRPGDPLDLARKIEGALSRPQLSASLARGAAATLEQFEPPAAMAALERALLEAAES